MTFALVCKGWIDKAGHSVDPGQRTLSDYASRAGVATSGFTTFLLACAARDAIKNAADDQGVWPVCAVEGS